jgi:hypothetical protein
MKRRWSLVGITVVGLFALTFALVGGWQAYESSTDPAVSAIRIHPVPAFGQVVEPEIDGFGGDPAVSYRYAVGGHTYTGFDLGSKATGDVLAMRQGDRIPIEYAATMPQISCVAESTDCPNSVYDPYLFVFVFWALAVVTGVVVGGSFAIRASVRRRHR